VSFLFKKTGLRGVAGYEVRQLDLSLMAGVKIGESFIRAGFASRVAIVGCELLSRYFSDETTSAIKTLTPSQQLAAECFGDGAAALVLSAEASHRSLAQLKMCAITNCPLSAAQRPAVDLRWVGLDAPSAARLPERVSLGDLRNALHLPFIQREQILLALRETSALSRFSQDDSKVPSAINSFFPGMREALFKSSDLPLNQEADSFERLGFVASVGAFFSIDSFISQGHERFRVFGLHQGATVGAVEFTREF
jgi:hypothetical protein